MTRIFNRQKFFKRNKKGGPRRGFVVFSVPHVRISPERAGVESRTVSNPQS
jgi:hypothetical protein